MIGVIDFLLMVVAAFALIPASMFFLEIIASFFSRVETAVAADVERGSLAIIVPAHNEGAHLLPTLRALKAALGPVDRLLVVADNCDDDTAANARKTGAEVIERQDSSRRGKGFALQFGIDYLREKPPTLVGFFDADVGFDDAAVAALAGAAVQTGRPCQALYLMQAPENASPKLAIAEFAWLLINKVRMLGLSRLADVTRFTGAGLVAPW